MPRCGKSWRYGGALLIGKWRTDRRMRKQPDGRKK